MKFLKFLLNMTKDFTEQVTHNEQQRSQHDGQLMCHVISLLRSLSLLLSNIPVYSKDQGIYYKETEVPLSWEVDIDTNFVLLLGVSTR